MADWLEPSHDRVVLTHDELRAIVQLEASLARDELVSSRTHAAGVDRAGFRYRALAVCVRWVRLAPWLIPVGLVLMLATMPSSMPASLCGALLAGVGLGCALPRIWLRARRAGARGRRRLDR